MQRVIGEIVSTVSGDVYVAARASAVRCVLEHYSQGELESIIEKYMSSRPTIRSSWSCAPGSPREGCNVVNKH